MKATQSAITTTPVKASDAVKSTAADTPNAADPPKGATAVNGVKPASELHDVALTETPISRMAPLKVTFGQPVISTANVTSTGIPILNPRPAQRTLTFSNLQGDHINQVVTFNTRSIENVSDVMDALNVSTSASIKYGTVKAGGSASFVNEHKINDSDLNYLVTVKVTNEYEPSPAKMKFLPIEGMPPEKFSVIYGDCFIAGFLEGGEFNAIVSIKVGKKENVKSVKLAAELALNVGPTPVTVGANASTDKEHNDTWSDTGQ